MELCFCFYYLYIINHITTKTERKMKKNDLKDPEYLEAQIEQTKDSLIALCEQLITVDKELGLEMLYEARMSFDLLYKHNNI